MWCSSPAMAFAHFLFSCQNSQADSGVDQETGGRASEGSGRPARWRGRGWAQRGLRGHCPCGCRGAPGRSSRAEGTHVGPPRADPTALADRSSNSGPRAATLLARDARTRGAGGDPSSGTPLTGHPGARLTEPLVTPRSLPQGAAPLTPSLCFFAVNEIIRNDLSGTNAHS